MQRSIAVVVTAFLSAVTVGAAVAQEGPPPPRRPSPEEVQKTMEGALGAMVPMMGRMADVAIEAQLRSAERPDTADRIATFKRNLFDALQKKGFSAAEAMQITLSTSPPMANAATR